MHRCCVHANVRQSLLGGDFAWVRMHVCIPVRTKYMLFGEREISAGLQHPHLTVCHAIDRWQGDPRYAAGRNVQVSADGTSALLLGFA